MTATEMYKKGALPAAIDAQIQVVKAKPADIAERLFLFEMLAFAGDLDKAQRQIEAVKYDDIERDSAVLAYRKLLDGERARRKVFAEGTKPNFFSDPPAHVLLRWEAVQRLREKKPVEAKQLLTEAASATPTVKGMLNNKAFGSFCDCDDLFAGILEVMSHGVYTWVPFEHIDSLAANPPKFPRDLLWFPAKLAIKDGPAGDAYLPALYPSSHEHADNQVKLGRATDWKESPDGPVLGVGLRTFLVGDDPLSLLEFRQVQFV